MKTLIKNTLAIALMATTALSTVSCDDDDNKNDDAIDATQQAVLTNYVNSVVIPTYKSLADAAILLAEDCEDLSTQAKNDPHYYIHDEVGYNYRMTNLQAALGVAQMEELPEFIRRKQRNYEQYRAEFEGFELAELMPFREGTESNKWFYSLKIDRSRVTASMREIITALQEQGIQTRAIWGLINEQKPYENEETYKLEKAPYYAARILNIPSSTQITPEEITYVADKVKQLLRSMANG